ncbi:hypothetical protein GON26_02710 [Flavobacterium sp. GA093]|uniref:Uncharacterized protein n=1 Tax=Flavobacterium hydrocarbonoxydans TaxID=2683249 RepID=A0A6I4NG55_9FLAO|nr:hypothetical protein [Flavobacterium hydrocarbonoxydans]MWB93258.1 hypothetical protein [Flavobacterium hydrocarbonoxydans]
MFITLTPDQVQFNYGTKRWQYPFGDILELAILKKKKTYFFENAAFIAVTALGYYAMLFSDLTEMYYIVPTLLGYSIITILRFHDTSESVYFVIVRDRCQKEIKVKIKTEDKNLIEKQINDYLDLEYHRILKKNA